MSSSFKQKKLKTLATRKKTHKRKMESGMTHEDESGRLFQPPSRRDPRWRKPDVATVVEGVVRAAKKRRVALADGDDDEQEDDDDRDEPEMVDPIESDAERGEESVPLQEEKEAAEPEDDWRPKPPVKLCLSLEDCIAAATKKHGAIRRKDTRQKAKVLILCDAPSLVKGLKKSLAIKPVVARSTSKLGVRSSGDKKVNVSYKNIAPLKTPMDKFQEANEDILKDYKVGKIATLVAEDSSFYPYSNLAIRHVIHVAKSASSVLNLDRALLDDVELHTFVVNDKGASLSADDKARLGDRFTMP